MAADSKSLSTSYSACGRILQEGDANKEDSPEISLTPDYIETFNRHCIDGTWGAQYIAETAPINPLIVEWNKPFDLDYKVLQEAIEIVLKKDTTNSFGQRSYMPQVIEIIKPKASLIMGVATNVCVDYALQGFAGKGIKGYVIADAIKELPVDTSIPKSQRLWTPDELFSKWKGMGAEIITVDQIKQYLS